MARSSDVYPLYKVWAQVRHGDLVLEIQNQRSSGWPDATEIEMYGRVRELSLYINAISSDKVSKLTTLEADAILDRIVEICGTLSAGLQLSNNPAVRTYNVDNSGTINSNLIIFSNRFTALTDTFASFAGKANQVLVVNGGETGVGSKALAGSDISYTPGAAGTALTATTVKTGLDQIDANTITNTASITTINTWKADIDDTGTGVVVKFANSPTNPRYTVRTVTAGANISVTNGDGVSGNPTVATSMTPSFTTVTTSGNATVGGNINVTGLVDGIDVSIADGLNLKRAGGQNSMSQDINMTALYKVMNAPAATGNGEYTIYQQVVRTTSDQTGIAGIKEYADPSVFKASIIKDNIVVGTTVTVDDDEQMIVGSDYNINGTLDISGDFYAI